MSQYQDISCSLQIHHNLLFSSDVAVDHKCPICFRHLVGTPLNVINFHGPSLSLSCLTSRSCKRKIGICQLVRFPRRFRHTICPSPSCFAASKLSTNFLPDLCRVPPQIRPPDLEMADPSKSPALTRSSVIAAHDIIKQYIHYTPVLTNQTLADLASTPQSAEALQDTPWAGQEPVKPKIRLWFKCENLQKVGAFKVRGAFHALTRLMTEEGWEAGGGREKGVVTHSSGLCLY